MRKYAQILNNKAHWVFEAEEIPEFAPNIVMKDITDVVPQPQEGWDYNQETGWFSPPAIAVPPEPSLTLEEQISQLKEDNLILKEDNLIIMDVLATMYEDMFAKGTV